MNRKIFGIISFLIIFYTTTFAGGSVNIFFLNNGLKVIHKEINNHPLCTVLLFARAGSGYEKLKQAGIANFTQTLLLQGTKSRSAKQLAQEIEDIGGHITSDIEKDFSVIGISVLDNHIEKASELLSDIVFNPIFLESEIEKERFNILAEIQSRQDIIGDVAEDIFLEKFYGEHPYSWPDIGKTDTVINIKREDIVSWHKDNFVGGNMVLVLAGNLSIDKAKKIADNFFSICPQGESNKEISPITKPNPATIIKKNNKFQQAYLMIGVPAPSLDNKDYPVFKVLNSLLGNRMSGRLFIEMREKLSLAYEVNSYFPTRKGLSRFVIYLGLKQENLDVAKNKINEIFYDLKNNLVNDHEIGETKNYIKGLYLLDHQTISRQAWYLGWGEILGFGYDLDNKNLTSMMKVQPQDIQYIVQTYFDEKNYIEVRIVPEKN